MKTIVNTRASAEHSAGVAQSAPNPAVKLPPKMVTKKKQKIRWINYQVANGKVVNPSRAVSQYQPQFTTHQQLNAGFELLPPPVQGITSAALLQDTHPATQPAPAARLQTLGKVITGIDDEGKTMLMHAAASGDLTMANTLIGRGVGINETNVNGWTAIDYAVEGAHFDVAALLLQHGGLIREQHLHHPSLLLDALLMGKREFAMLLILLGAPRSNVETQGRSALHMAVEMQDMELVSQLVCAENINLQDVHGATALHLAASLADSRSTALLLQHQAAINLTDSCGQTPLLYACDLDDSTVAMQLLAAKAQTTQLNCNGQTPLIVATQAGKLDVVRLLVVAGAEVNRPGGQGYTALDLARQAGNAPLIAILQAAGGQ
jgi:ankyrin repeat protein